VWETLNVLLTPATVWAGLPSPHWIVALQVSAPGSVNDTSSVALAVPHPTDALTKAALVTVGATLSMATVNEAESESPSLSVTVTVMV
jgi:hypothetical protein